MARGPIIFDFTTGKAHRAKAHRPRDLTEALRPAKRRVIKRVEGLPPQVVQQKP
jgi:hypothetical protein